MDRLMEVDPLLLILRNDIYIRIDSLSSPPDRIIGHVRQILKSFGSDEQILILHRVRAVGAYANAIEKELSTKLSREEKT